jgi:hypothetical protein
MKIFASHSLRILPAALGLAFALAANNAKAATSYYFHVNSTASGYGIVANNTYSWDSTMWSTTSGGAPTLGWQAGGFPRLNSATTPYTVNVGADESMAGMYVTTASAVTINQTPSTSGTLDLVTGDQGFLCASGGSLIINAPISGSGGVAPQLSGGNIYLYGPNTYSGGTAFGYSGTPLTYFNNGSSFGNSSGALRIVAGVTSGTFFGLLGKGASPITIPNPVQILSTGTGFNFAADANTPVTSSGNWSLGANNAQIRSSGGSTSPLTISGAITGSGNVAFSANNNSAIILTGGNSYFGTTTVGVGGTPVTLKLGAQDTISTSSSVIMAGGTLDPGGFHHSLSGTLGLTASSTLDYTSGAAEMDYANSSSVAWTAAQTLNLKSTTGGNWNLSGDELEVGTDATGLTAPQLAEIEFNGTDLGDAGIDPNGFVYDTVQPTPEPSTLALGLLGALGLMRSLRRRTA